MAATSTLIGFAQTGDMARQPVRYFKRGLRITEVYFDAESDPGDADIVRYRAFSHPVEGTTGGETPTLQVDLRPEPGEILAQMRRRARRKLKAAETMGFLYESDFAGNREWTRSFCEYFDRFAPLKRLPLANRERIEGMRSAGVLFLSRMRDASGEELVWHASYAVGGILRLFHSASLFRGRKDEAGNADREFAAKVGDANACLHWMDMLQARSMGCHTYDFGSWHSGQDPENLRINEFKEGFGGKVVRLYCFDRGLTLKGKAACYARKLQGMLRGNR